MFPWFVIGLDYYGSRVWILLYGQADRIEQEIGKPEDLRDLSRFELHSAYRQDLPISTTMYLSGRHH